MPSLEDLGIVVPDGEHVWKGGETEALKRLESLLSYVSIISDFYVLIRGRSTKF